MPWALLASDRDGQLKFAGPAILNPPRQDREKWGELMASLAVAKPPLKGLRLGSAQWLTPELRVRVQHLKAKGTLRHASGKGSSPIEVTTDWTARSRGACSTHTRSMIDVTLVTRSGVISLIP